MRLSSPLRRCALAVAAAAAVGGCTALDQMLTMSSGFDPTKHYLTDPSWITLEPRWVDRYACASGRPLMCTCTGRLSECDCHC